MYMSQPEAVVEHTGKATSNALKDDLSLETLAQNEWEASHTYSKSQKVETTSLHPPGAAWRARELSRTHVQHVKQSFRKHHTANKNIIAVVVNTRLYNKWQQDLADGPVLKADRWEWLNTNVYGPNAEAKMQVVSGDHSRAALTELHMDAPSTDIWFFVDVKLLLCPDDPVTTEKLLILGVRENITAAVQLKHSYCDMLYDAHRRVMKWRNDNPRAKMGTADRTKLKAAIMFAWQVQKGNAGLLFNLACRGGECWALIKDLYDGKAKPLKSSTKGKRIMTPASYNPFVQATSLPDNVVAAILKRVLNGELNIPNFKVECDKAKWAGVVIDRATEHAAQTCADVCAEAMRVRNLSTSAPFTWAILQETWPAIDSKFVDLWVEWYMSLKNLDSMGSKTRQQQLPAGFYEKLDSILKPPQVCALF